MFVIVKFGEEQEEIFNPGCRNDILLQFIKQRCQVNKEEVVELSDERGVIKNLRHFPQDYASSHLKNRETLILLRVENALSLQSLPEETGVERTMFIPLLASLTANTEFIDILNPAKDDDTRSEASLKSRRRSSMQDADDPKTCKGKARGAHLSSLIIATKKPTSRRGQRPPLRKHANTS